VSPRAGPQGVSARGLFWTLVALLLLAGASLGLRFAHLGSAGIAVALAIAAAKAVVVMLVFMELLRERASVRYAILTGFGLMALLIVLLVADVMTRTIQPLEPPQAASGRYHG
jgi:cytochrome c oxidase subunit 4